MLERARMLSAKMQTVLTVDGHGHGWSGRNCWQLRTLGSYRQGGQPRLCMCVSLCRFSPDPQRSSLEDVPSVPFHV